ncbi:MAG: hypothetical protein OEZ03_12335 [Alphaproteobacteria bacterium]|nr:hypothetical protein [Alphaproteobacteria bacterium]
MTIFRARFVLFLAALLIAPSFAGAQTIDNKLKGVKKLALTFEPFDADSIKCGVGEGLLASAMEREAKAIPVKFDGSVYIFQVRVATLAQPAICFTSADISVYRFEEVRLSGDKRDLHAKVIIWENGTILGSSPKTHGRDVARTMADLMKAFVNDWRKDNG